MLGLATSFLIDTGATESFIASHLLDRVEPRLKPDLLPAGRRFRQADGRALRVDGRARVWIDIGGTEIQHDKWVADISDDAILGLDFLRENRCPLVWEEDCFTVGQHRVPLQENPREPVVCRVRLAENVVVPPDRVGNSSGMPGHLRWWTAAEVGNVAEPRDKY